MQSKASVILSYGLIRMPIVKSIKDNYCRGHEDEETMVYCLDMSVRPATI